jgi:hypothetical protein
MSDLPYLHNNENGNNAVIRKIIVSKFDNPYIYDVYLHHQTARAEQLQAISSQSGQADGTY